MRLLDSLPAHGPGTLLAVALLLAAAPAFAHGGDPTPPAQVPAAPTGTEGATAQKLLEELKAHAAKDPETARVVAEPVRKAEGALERAHGARLAGDQPHARMMDGLALEWAETARDLERASASEGVALSTAKQARETATKVDRARTLLEEMQARRERAAAELQQAEADAKHAAVAAAESEEQRLARGTSKGSRATRSASAVKRQDRKKGSP